MLTRRAQQYLATFQRGPYLPVEEVERLLEQGGYPSFEPWLDFHARYAGYKDDAANGLLLGLAQPVSRKCPAFELHVRSDDWGRECRIQIADTDDLMYEQYEMDSKGEVSFAQSFQAESFDRKVERDALLWEFEQQCQAEYVDDAAVGDLLPLLENDWIPEASDKFIDAYRNARYLFFVETRTRVVRNAFENPGGLGMGFSGSGTRKPRRIPRLPGTAPAFLPIHASTPFDLSSNPARRLVERVSLLGNLPQWDPQAVSAAIGATLVPMVDDPSDPQRRYFAGRTDVFEKVKLTAPTRHAQFDWLLVLTPVALPAEEPRIALAPILPPDTRGHVAWPKKQEGKPVKHHDRVVEIGETEIGFVFEGKDFEGPQRVTSVCMSRPAVELPSGRYERHCFRVEQGVGSAYSIQRIDDGSEVVDVADIIENPEKNDRLSIRFRCLDPMMTLQDASSLITVLIVQGERRARYLNRVEHLDYTDLDSGLEYTRLWSQRGGAGHQNEP